MGFVARWLSKLPSLRYNHVVALGLAFTGLAWPDVPLSAPAPWPLAGTDALASNAERRARQREIAKHWAPAFYQDTDASFYVGDYITNFDFDGDYNGKNNWESLEGRSSVPAHVYYAVSETESHYFLNYSVFHPRDWHEFNPLDEHENDFEGVTLAVRKNGTWGELIALQTLAHGRFSQYSGRGDVASSLETVDGSVSLRGGHPRLYIEAKGHGIYGCDERCERAEDGDGILYEVGERAEQPTGGDGNYTRRVHYALIAMDADGSDGKSQGLWHRRNDICDTCTFGAWGKLRGDNYGTNRAAMPWLWSESHKAPFHSGDMLCDPAFFFDARLNGPAFDRDFSHHYVAHPFRTHVVAGEVAGAPRRRDAAFRLPRLNAVRFGGLRLGGERQEHSVCRPEEPPDSNAFR